MARSDWSPLDRIFLVVGGRERGVAIVFTRLGVRFCADSLFCTRPAYPSFFFRGVGVALFLGLAVELSG